MVDPAFMDLLITRINEIIVTEDDPLTSIGKKVPLPLLDVRDITSLLTAALARFQSQPIILEINSPVYIVGDIHGNLQDLIRIFRECGTDATYLFLGDYVDRGYFSLECLLFLFALMWKCPNRFYLIRGNHECRVVASQYGFKKDIMLMYPDYIFDYFVDVFKWIPLAAVIDGSIFCVHGGICPGLQTISQINELVRPIEANGEDNLVVGLLWNDPSPNDPGFSQSPRGLQGASFGKDALNDFLRPNGLRTLVRGHQCVDGVQQVEGMNVYTVFSSSNYLQKNRCGVLEVSGGIIRPMIFQKLIAPVFRDDISFTPIERGQSSLLLNKSRLFKIQKSTSLGGPIHVTDLMVGRRRTASLQGKEKSARIQVKKTYSVPESFPNLS